jgi:hypothetical protein
MDRKLVIVDSLKKVDKIHIWFLIQIDFDILLLLKYNIYYCSYKLVCKLIIVINIFKNTQYYTQ